MHHSTLISAALGGILTLSMGCEPVSTADLGSQENSLEVSGQRAMASQDGTLGDPSTAELEPTHQNTIDFADPDPFVDYDTIHEEQGIEGDEND